MRAVSRQIEYKATSNVIAGQESKFFYVHTCLLTFVRLSKRLQRAADFILNYIIEITHNYLIRCLICSNLLFCGY